MKTIKFFLLVVLCVTTTFSGKAQTTNDYFVGKWSVITIGIPSGDVNATIVLTRVDNKLVGTYAKEKEAEVKFSKIEEKEKSVTLYFSMSGYDVSMNLDKVDENHMNGTTMSMFESKATRIADNTLQTNSK